MPRRDRFAGLRTPRWRAAWSPRSRRAPAPTAGSALSFEIAYGHGFKAAPRLQGGDVAVSLDDMRAMVRRPPPTAA